MNLRPRALGALVFVTTFLAAIGATADPVERADWAELFDEKAPTATIVISDERGEGADYVNNPERANERFSPASTFKIPHALIALDTGVVKDEFQILPWDGVERWYDKWNRDQTLRSSMRYSALWLYQEFAREIGREKELAYLNKLDYGNSTIGKDVDLFWVDGSLKISANEQIAFLKRLYRNELPFDVDDQLRVKDVMVRGAGADWIERGKTGWATETEIDPSVGWYVGWVDRDEGPVFFALNMEMEGGMEDAPLRVSIARMALQEIGALPAD